MARGADELDVAADQGPRVGEPRRGGLERRPGEGAEARDLRVRGPARARRAGGITAEQADQFLAFAQGVAVRRLDGLQGARDVGEPAQERVEAGPVLRHGAERLDVRDGEARRVGDLADHPRDQGPGLVLAPGEGGDLVLGPHAVGRPAARPPARRPAPGSVGGRW